MPVQVVYMEKQKITFNETDIADHPIQFYAATTLMNLWLIPIVNYTKLDHWSKIFYSLRPMVKTRYVSFKICKKNNENKKIDLFNYGNHTRDFTYVDDIVDGIFKIITKKQNIKIVKVKN